MNEFRRIGRGMTGLALLGATLAGCAAPPPPSAANLPAPQAATVLVVRPLDPAVSLPGTLAPILPAGTTHPPSGLAEMILRTGDGAVISVVQPPLPGLMPGQSVLLRNGMAVLPASPQS